MKQTNETPTLEYHKNLGAKRSKEYAFQKTPQWKQINERLSLSPTTLCNTLFRHNFCVESKYKFFSLLTLLFSSQTQAILNLSLWGFRFALSSHHRTSSFGCVCTLPLSLSSLRYVSLSLFFTITPCLVIVTNQLFDLVFHANC